MIFKKKDRLVGLDIGSSSIKVAEFSESKNGVILKKFGIMPLEPGLIEDGRIKDMDGVAQRIRELFIAENIQTKNVAVSTGGHAVVIKTITAPRVPDDELHETIHSEAEQYIPYDIGEVNVDFQVLGLNEFYENQLNVLLVAAKKELVDEYVDLVTRAGLVPKVIDVDAFALQNMFDMLPQSKAEKIVMLADVGASKMSMNILKDGQPVMMRDNTHGVGQIIEEMAHRLGLETAAAETLWRDPAQWGDNKEVIEDICSQAVRTWCTEIAEVAHNFHASSEGSLERVFLSGGGAYVQGFYDQLTMELGAPVEPMMPLSGMEVDSRTLSQDLIAEVEAQSGIALGLALRRVDDK